MEHTVILDFSKDEWNKFVYSYEQTTAAQRRKFSKGFDFEINDRLKQRFGLSCWLHSSHNYFRQPTSIRSTSPYWRGVFNCLNKDCDIKFTCSVQDINAEVDFVRMNVEWSGRSQHSDCCKARQCRGEARTLMAMKAMADGVSKTLASNINENFDKGKKGELTSVLFILNYLLNHKFT